MPLTQTSAKFEELRRLHPSEEWRDVVGQPGYAVSNQQRIWSFPKGRSQGDCLIYGNLCASLGYRQVSMNGKNLFWHRIVGEAFLPQPLTATHRYIDHIDRNRENNALENLRWATTAQNRRNTVRANQTGYAGVWYDARYVLPWRACISRADGAREHLAGFASAREAGVAVARRVAQEAGEFAPAGIRALLQEEGQIALTQATNELLAMVWE